MATIRKEISISAKSSGKNYLLEAVLEIMIPGETEAVEFNFLPKDKAQVTEASGATTEVSMDSKKKPYPGDGEDIEAAFTLLL